MKKISEGTTTIDEILEDPNSPKTLFKFRNWDNNHHKKVLTRKEIYFASPKQFEDPLDCKIPTRYDLLTSKERVTFLTRLTRQSFPWLSVYEQIQLIAQKFRDQEIWTSSRMNSIEGQMSQRLDESYGVFSLCADLENPDLWDYYAPSPNGFAVGIDPRVVFPTFGGGGPVHYFKTIPIIKPEPIMTNGEQMFRQFYSKHEKWKWEKEYRTMIVGRNLTKKERTRVLDPSAFVGVWVRNSATHEFIDEIRESLHHGLKGLPIERF